MIKNLEAKITVSRNQKIENASNADALISKHKFLKHQHGSLRELKNTKSFDN